ncbi:MAG TPA: sigma-E processing peptidase SpoIIGA [Thermoclostridium caenicola]|uniref:Sporulation sigma-E factor-processing peptidase n=1 Tax=Thermoclostridium caenicola TaxID=659425 RepID=A0A1M6GGT6_9FIRM|nr:sigma-E processing peptidase SpoIIGA [Thermoclostridium caenicola]SHJ09206.1 stage II sporulation protein GA (sporulation sigma-E factor processing peptidase) [Thermoclostridium caenicola]HOK43353.1 sigma-E processing peptidase SpoIIGA [Thermoclostridium caenicola]HOL83884.1 sigma-E processing peptidase SpoIIGA [Thermoclostridium caenicola]HOP73077.1 sigma-E processing peptidase SpoIIGA [Thermoclostridium caenicola]HPO75619.1 sigma-E processing peptidase SpoIIGA [Thermoclostridium caenicola
MVVYADMLFLENLLANCFILKLTSVMSGFPSTLWRILLSASVGSLYAVFAVIYQSNPLIASLLVKMLISMLMVLIAFRVRNTTDFLKRWGIMLLVAFMLGGCTYAFSGVLGESMLTYGGLMYISPQGVLKAFLFAAGLCIILVRPIGRILSGKAIREGNIVRVNVILGKRSARFNALIDTGNSLIDPLTGYPVMIVEAESVKDIVPPDVYNFFLSSKVSDGQIKDEINPSWKSRMHLIPFKSIGRENGILAGFRPDAIRVLHGNSFKELRNVIVGICGIKLSNNSRYTALIGPASLANI